MLRCSRPDAPAPANQLPPFTPNVEPTQNSLSSEARDNAATPSSSSRAAAMTPRASRAVFQRTMDYTDEYAHGHYVMLDDGRVVTVRRDQVAPYIYRLDTNHRYGMIH